MSTEPRASLASRWFAALLPRRGWVLATCLAWTVAGLLSFSALRRDLFPDLSLPTLNVLLQNPGGGAAELELTVAQPVEQALGGLAGVKRVTSIVQAGVVQVVVSFESGEDPWRARQLVAERLSSLAGGFPSGTVAPLVTSAAGRLLEIQEIVLEGPAVDPMVLRDVTERLLVPRLQSVRGVARVERLGGQERQLQVSLLPERMRLYGVGLDAVAEALDGSQRDVSAGTLEIQDKAWLVSVGSLAATPEEVRRLAVHGSRGMVTLAEVAEVREAPGFRRGLARHDGHEDVSLRVVKQPGAATFTTSRAVRGAVEELARELPNGTSLSIVYDQAELVERALSGVSRALFLGGAFVALVILGLLGNLRAALVVLAVLPLATLGAAIPLLLLGVGLNAMTLGGLAIAVGLLVDASVIMVENLAHRLASRSGERRTVLVGAASEVAIPILTAVAVILVVFIPLLAVGGVAGRLYAPLALSVASAMTISLALTFTLVPVLAERLLPDGATLREPRVVGAVKRVYAPALAWALRHGVLVRVLSLAITVPCVWLAVGLGTDFLPRLDEGALMLQSRLPAETSLEATDDANALLERELAGVPGVKSVYRRTGRSDVTEDPMPTTASDVLVILDRAADPSGLTERIAERVESLPFGVEITSPMQMRISEGIGGTPADLQVKLFGADLDALAAALPEIAEGLEKVEGVAAVTPEGSGGLPRWRLVPNDDALRRLGVPRPLVARTLQAALQGLEGEPRFAGAQRIGRVVRFPNDGRVTVEKLKSLPLVLEDGRIVELGQVTAFEEGSTPSVIRRDAGQRRLALNLRVARDLGGTARRVEEAMARAALPPGTVVRLGGKIEEARETRARLVKAIAVALVLVVVLLQLALGSLREVAVIAATLPDAFAGGLLALWIAGETWNVSSIVGMIGLFGVAVQNSLVLVTQTKDLVARGVSFGEALTEASLARVRPKLMTAGSAILGLAPMLFGIGGSELERPLAIVMIGGLVTSTLFTLLALPSFYAWVAGSASRGDGTA